MYIYQCLGVYYCMNRRTLTIHKGRTMMEAIDKALLAYALTIKK